MIGIFNNKTSKADLTLYNGEYMLDNVCLKAEVTEELNGEYSLDIIFAIADLVNKKAYDLMVNDSLIKIEEEYGIEFFRIAKVIKGRTKIEIFARHITIADTLNLFCEDVRPTGLNGAGALSWIFNNSRGTNWLNVSSNITTSNTAYYLNKTVYEALFTAENSFINVWGGEALRRGFNLSINSRVGSDRGVTIRSGKNLRGFEERSNLNTLATSVYPVGFDGITINEKYINSPYVNNYSKIYPLVVKFDDVAVQSETNTEGFPTLAEAQAELKRRVNLMYSRDKVDILTSSYTVTFAELSTAEGYKQYSILESTWLGDTIGVFEEKLGINIQVRVIKRIYNILKKKRISTELSNKDINYKPPTLVQVIEKINNIADSVDTGEILTQAKTMATALLQAGLKNSYVVFKENEILILDTKDINTAKKVWRFNNAGLGYSSTGYFGEYGIAITQDGSIVADFMNTGLLKSLNGTSWINLDSGTFNFANKISFDGATFNIDLAGKDLATNSSVDSKISTVNTNHANLTATVNGLSSTVGSHTNSITGLNTSVATAQSTANGKAKIFTTTPTVPYNVGDLWVGGTSSNIMRCKTARATGSYTASEWEKADKYTDDAKANEVAGNLATTNTNVTALTTRVNTAETSITQLNSSIALKVGAQEVTNAIAKIEIGGRNLALGTSNIYSEGYADFTGSENKGIPLYKVINDGLNLNDDVIASLVVKYTDIVATEGQTPTILIQGRGDVTGWSAGSFGSSSRQEILGSGEIEIIYSFKVSTERLTNSFWDTYLRTDFILSGNIQYKMFKVEIGTKPTDWTPATEDIYSHITTVSSEQVESFHSSLELTASNITNSVAETYATKTDTAEEFNKLATSLTQSAEDFNFKIESERAYTETVEGELQGFKNTVETNINFNENGITISKQGSPFASSFTDTKLSFTQDSNEVAYISNNKMFITDTEISNSLTIGSVGFLPRQNGNLSIVWKEA